MNVDAGLLDAPRIVGGVASANEVTDSVAQVLANVGLDVPVGGLRRAQEHTATVPYPRRPSSPHPPIPHPPTPTHRVRDDESHPLVLDHAHGVGRGGRHCSNRLANSPTRSPQPQRTVSVALRTSAVVC